MDKRRKSGHAGKDAIREDDCVTGVGFPVEDVGDGDENAKAWADESIKATEFDTAQAYKRQRGEEVEEEVELEKTKVIKERVRKIREKRGVDKVYIEGRDYPRATSFWDFILEELGGCLGIGKKTSSPSVEPSIGASPSPAAPTPEIER